MRKVALVVTTALAVLLVVAGAEAAPPVRGPLVADEQSACPNGDLTPTPAAFTGRPARRAPVDLDVLVVADPVAMADAQEAFERAATAFSPHGIRLASSFRDIPVPDMDGDDRAYMKWVKQLVGGTPPAGFDVVYLALHHPIGVGGRASCIGGIAFETEAFAIGMLTTSGLVGVTIEPWSPIPPGPPIPDAGAKIAAHEIGHLLGAHHHYGQCGLGFRSDDPTHPCDVMFSAAKQQFGLFFGPVTGPVITYYARAYARP